MSLAKIFCGHDISPEKASIKKDTKSATNWKDLKLKIAKSAMAVISCSGLNSKVGFFVKYQDNKESMFKILEF